MVCNDETYLKYINNKMMNWKWYNKEKEKINKNEMWNN